MFSLVRSRQNAYHGVTMFATRMQRFVYRHVAKPIFFRRDPEEVHDATTAAVAASSAGSPADATVPASPSRDMTTMSPRPRTADARPTSGRAASRFVGATPGWERVLVMPHPSATLRRCSSSPSCSSSCGRPGSSPGRTRRSPPPVATCSCRWTGSATVSSCRPRSRRTSTSRAEAASSLPPFRGETGPPWRARSCLSGRATYSRRVLSATQAGRRPRCRAPRDPSSAARRDIRQGWGR